MQQKEAAGKVSKLSSSKAPKNPENLLFIHSFLMKYSDLAPKSGQNDTQLAIFSTKFHRFQSFLLEKSEIKN